MSCNRLEQNPSSLHISHTHEGTSFGDGVITAQPMRVELRRLAGTFVGNRWATRDANLTTFTIDNPLINQQSLRL